MSNAAYIPSDAAREASDYFNSLPFEERAKLAPLLENYRQMGLAEARKEIGRIATLIDVRIRGIKAGDSLPSRETSLPKETE